jgi:hypothetical protein
MHPTQIHAIISLCPSCMSSGYSGTGLILVCSDYCSIITTQMLKSVWVLDVTPQHSIAGRQMHLINPTKSLLRVPHPHVRRDCLCYLAAFMPRSPFRPRTDPARVSPRRGDQRSREKISISATGSVPRGSAMFSSAVGSTGERAGISRPRGAFRARGSGSRPRRARAARQRRASRAFYTRGGQKSATKGVPRERAVPEDGGLHNFSTEVYRSTG